MVTDAVEVHVCASVTVTMYVPAVALVSVESVPNGVLQAYVKGGFEPTVCTTASPVALPAHLSLLIRCGVAVTLFGTTGLILSTRI